ncbi:Histidine phosphatase superfamily, clade-2 like protein [Aduncisulcus paluster]|uniref:Histidine phosphatase superfamily, clade-2 like protein n=1 Tax=Aduncisulcus paluster TaxID=2918883 RepID=A0ABQ5JYB2_9EUKA|nr:Histidine phosphatase superfamily, clade-2 like protein [Aduncisulcus paluster]
MERQYSDQVLHTTLIFRHGERSPTHTFNNDPYADQWDSAPRSQGTLTDIGQQHLYTLGSQYKDIYGHGQFVSDDFDISEVYMQAVGDERGVMTGQAFLQSFYPPSEETGLPNQIVVTPIVALDPDRDPYFRAPHSCQALKDYSSNEMTVSPQWKSKQDSEIDFFTLLTSRYDLDSPLKLSNIDTLFDPLECDIAQFGYDETLSAFKLTEDEYERIVSDKQFTLSQKYPANNQIAQLYSPINIIISENISDYLDGTTNEGFANIHFYFAHSGSIYSALSSLGFSDIEPVPFASLFKIELIERTTESTAYEDGSDQSKQYLVSLTLDDSPVRCSTIEKFALDNCSLSYNVVNRTAPTDCDGEHGLIAEGVYSWDLYRQFVDAQPTIPEWNTLCGNDTPNNNVSTPLSWWWGIIFGILTAGVILLFIWIIWKLIRRHKHNKEIEDFGDAIGHDITLGLGISHDSTYM